MNRSFSLLFERDSSKKTSVSKAEMSAGMKTKHHGKSKEQWCQENTRLSGALQIKRLPLAGEFSSGFGQVIFSLGLGFLP